jgi:hypothetical protein
MKDQCETHDSSVAKRALMLLLPSIAFCACAQLSISPQSAERPDPTTAGKAIAAEPIRPTQIIVRDFEFSPSSIKDNSSPLHRLLSRIWRRPADENRFAIGHAAIVNLSQRTVKRLNKLGFAASRTPTNSNLTRPNDILLVTGRLLDADEGNRLTRVALGLGAGESKLDTEVHVFRVAQGEQVEVLTFRTHADSGKMPGVVPSLGAGELFIGTISTLAKVKNAFSTGDKIYNSQIDHLASRTGDEIGRYLSLYAADEGWIPWERAKPVKLAAEY